MFTVILLVTEFWEIILASEESTHGSSILIRYETIIEDTCNYLLPGLRPIIDNIKFKQFMNIEELISLFQVIGKSGINQNLKIMLDAVKQNGQALIWASDELKQNRQLVMIAVEQSGKALKQVDAKFKNEFAIVLLAVKQDGLALQYASDELKNDREIVLAAVRSNWNAYRFASPTFQFDKADSNMFAMKEMSEHLKKADDDDDSQHVFTKLLYDNRDLILTWRQYSLTVKDYRRTFLFGIHSTSGSKLSLLNKLGKYGLNDMKRRVADYAGLQYGSYYQLIADALKLIERRLNIVDPFAHLDRPGFNWTLFSLFGCEYASI
jgi:hypothetical protein